MGVGVERYRYGGVAHEFLHVLRVHAFGEKQRSACVAQVVEADMGETGLLEERGKRSLAEV